MTDRIDCNGAKTVKAAFALLLCILLAGGLFAEEAARLAKAEAEWEKAARGGDVRQATADNPATTDGRRSRGGCDNWQSTGDCRMSGVVWLSVAECRMSLKLES